MLLVPDGAAFLWRHYEPVLDSRIGCVHSHREDDTDGAMARMDCRRWPGGLGRDAARKCAVMRGTDDPRDAWSTGSDPCYGILDLRTDRPALTPHSRRQGADKAPSGRRGGLRTRVDFCRRSVVAFQKT
jgi:hypothetical protein